MSVTPKDETLRALYTEAGEMLRACETATANLLLVAATICAAAVGAEGGGWLSANAAGWVLITVVLVLTPLLLRVRLNQAHYFRTLCALEASSQIDRKYLPHHYNNTRLDRTFSTPLNVAYAIVFTALLAVGCYLAAKPPIEPSSRENSPSIETITIDMSDTEIAPTPTPIEPRVTLPAPASHERKSRVWSTRCPC